MLEPELSVVPEFSITTASLDGSIIISVCGELDMTTAPQLEEALATCNGDQPVVVDMTTLTFIDSSGLHVLLQKRSTGRPTALVVSPKSHVARVFDIVCASKSVDLCSDLDAAVKKIREAGPSQIVRRNVTTVPAAPDSTLTESI